MTELGQKAIVPFRSPIVTTTLVIGNKLYSSWSMRPWLLLRHNAIAFEEVVVPLRRAETGETIRRHSPAGKVPVLIDDGFAVWDSLAICEYVGERWPEASVWPGARDARALARSISAEMHSGFMALRRGCPMDLGRRFAERERGEEVARDVARIEAIWAEARHRFGEATDQPFLFGAFGAADAMYAPVVTRFETWGIRVGGSSRRYMDAVLALPAYREWRDAALAEEWTIEFGDETETLVADLRAGLSAGRA